MMSESRSMERRYVHRQRKLSDVALRRLSFSRQHSFSASFTIDDNEEFEKVLERVGPFGKFQLRQWLMHTLAMITIVANLSLPILGNGCKTNSNSSNNSMPITYHFKVLENLQLIMDNKLNVIQCLHLRTQILGLMCGSLVFGQIADLVGRKWVIWVCYSSSLILGLASAFTTEWKAFLTLRFILSIFGAGYLTVSRVMMAELTDNKHHLFVRSFCGWPFGLGYFVALSFFAKRWVILAINGQGLLVLLALMTISESPRWLIQQQNEDEDIGTQDTVSHQNPVSLLRHISRVNRKHSYYAELGCRVDRLKPIKEEVEKKPIVCHLFLSKEQTILTVLLSMLALVTAFTTSFAVQIHLLYVSGGSLIFFSIMVGGCTQVVMWMIIVIDRCAKIERKSLLAFVVTLLLIAYWMLASVYFIDRSGSADVGLLRHLSFWLIVIISALTSVSMQCEEIISLEGFPTTIRAIGVSWMGMMTYGSAFLGIVVSFAISNAERRIDTFVACTGLLIFTIVCCAIFLPKTRRGSVTYASPSYNSNSNGTDFDSVFGPNKTIPGGMSPPGIVPTYTIKKPLEFTFSTGGLEKIREKHENEQKSVA